MLTPELIADIIVLAAIGVFDLYQNQEKTQATQTFGLSITSTIDNVRVGGRYKGILRSSLGEESTVLSRFNNEFGVNVNWDPNK